MISPVLFRNTIVLFFIITSVSLNAQNGWTEPINLSNSPDKMISYYSGVIDQNGVIYVVWGECFPLNDSQTSINLSKSTDNGISWSEPELISDNRGVYLNPEMAVDSKGNIHVIYFKKYEERYFYITSENGWSHATPISDYHYAKHAKILVDKKDKVHFFWTHWQPPEHIVHRTLFEGEWSDTTIVSDLSVSSVTCDAVVDEGNVLHLVFEGFPGSNFELNYRRLNDYGWSEPEKIITDTVDLAHFKLTLVDEDQPLVAWEHLVSWYDTLIIRIYWIRKILGKWSTPEQLSDLSKSYYPTLTTDKSNIAYIAWSRRIHGTIPSTNDSLFSSYYQNNLWSTAKKIPFNLPPPLYGCSLNNFGNRIYLLFIAENQGRLSDLYFSSRSILTDVNEVQQKKIDDCFGVYPNPFNSETKIRFKMSRAARVGLKLFDILGRETRILLDEEKTEGEHEYYFNANGLASGIYLLRLRINEETLLRKLIITK